MNGDDLLNQITNISKAHAYDIASKQVIELKEVIRELIAFGELEELKFTEPLATAAFQKLVNKAKTLSL